MDEQARSQPCHVRELDGLRGCLALWVATSHIFCWCGFSDWKPPWPLSRFWGDFVFAQPAVEVFIILSGFAITSLLERRRPTYSKFMTGRFFRIYPVYIVCLFAGLAANALVPEILASAPWKENGYFLRILRPAEVRLEELSHLPAHFVAHLTLLFGLIPRDVLPLSTATLLVPAWSISLEWQYYLVAPALARLVRSGTGLLIALMTIWLGQRFGFLWEGIHQAFLPAQLPLFLIGIGMYHAFERSAAPGGRPTDYAVFSAVLMIVALVTSWHTMALGIWAICFGSVSARSWDPFSRGLGLVNRLLRHRWLQFAGLISYPLYLIHWPLIILMVTGVLRAWPSVSPTMALAILLCLGMPLIVLAAYGLHRLVEAPGMAMGKQLAGRVDAASKDAEGMARPVGTAGRLPTRVA
jgi:peptidoglycan/LPS O-acetylase OafA/YrhL